MPRRVHKNSGIDARARRVARRLEIRRPTRKPYDSMFRDGFEADGHERDDEFERDEENSGGGDRTSAGLWLLRRWHALLVAPSWDRRGPESKPGRGLLFLGAGRGGIAREVRRARPRREFRRERYLDAAASRARRAASQPRRRAEAGGGCSASPATPRRPTSRVDPGRRPARRAAIRRKPCPRPDAEMLSRRRARVTLVCRGKTAAGARERGTVVHHRRLLARSRPARRVDRRSRGRTPRPGRARSWWRAAGSWRCVARPPSRNRWSVSYGKARGPKPWRWRTPNHTRKPPSFWTRMRTRATETRSRPIARLVFFPTWRARRRVFSPSRRWTTRRRRDIFPIPPPSNPPNFSRTSKDAKTRTRRRSGVPSDRNICAACPSGDDGGSTRGASTHVETVVAEGIVASRTKTRFGDGKVSESDAKTLCLAAKTHLASYLASRAIRPSDPHGRRLDTALCVLWADGRGGRVGIGVGVEYDPRRRSRRRRARRDARGTPPRVRRLRVRDARARNRDGALAPPRDGRRRRIPAAAKTAAAPSVREADATSPPSGRGRRRDASPKTLRGGGRSGRSDARGRAREATRALDSRARSRRGCVGARGSESATRDASAGRDGARGTPRRRGGRRRVGGAVRAEDARSPRPRCARRTRVGACRPRASTNVRLTYSSVVRETRLTLTSLATARRARQPFGSSRRTPKYSGGAPGEARGRCARTRSVRVAALRLMFARVSSCRWRSRSPPALGRFSSRARAPKDPVLRRSTSSLIATSFGKEAASTRRVAQATPARGFSAVSALDHRLSSPDVLLDWLAPPVHHPGVQLRLGAVDRAIPSTAADLRAARRARRGDGAARRRRGRRRVGASAAPRGRRRRRRSRGGRAASSMLRSAGLRSRPLGFALV